MGLFAKMLAESLAGTMRIVCKWSWGTFGTNGVILMLFGLAAADQLMVDLGVMNQTAFL
jgi:hypothetical protein